MPVTSTGVQQLDKALGKAAPGYPIGGIVEVCGLPQSGTSAVCAAATAAALAENEEVVYYDFGGDILERMRVEEKLRVYVNPDQEGAARATVLMAAINSAVQSGVRLFVVDSIDRIMGDRRLFNTMRIAQRVRGSSTTLLIARRYPEHPDPSPWNELAYHSDLRIRLSCHKDEDEPELHKVRADLIKVRAGKPRAAEFYLRNGLIETPSRRKRQPPEEAPSRFDREDIV